MSCVGIDVTVALESVNLGSSIFIQQTGKENIPHVFFIGSKSFAMYINSFITAYLCESGLC